MKKLLSFFISFSIMFSACSQVSQLIDTKKINIRTGATLGGVYRTTWPTSGTADSITYATNFAVGNYFNSHIHTLQQTTGAGASTTVFSSFTNGAYVGPSGLFVNNGAVSSQLQSKATSANKNDTLPDASGTVALESWVAANAGGKITQALFGMTGTVVIPANTMVKQIAIVINNYVQRVTIGSTLHGTDYFDDVVTVGTPYMVLINTFFSSSTTLYLERYDSGHPAALWTVIVYYN